MGSIIETSPLGVYHMTGNQAIPQNTNWSVPIIYLENNAAFDFSTYTAKLQVKQTYDSAVLLELNTSNGGITLAAGSLTTPNVTLIFLAPLTAAMTVYTDMIYDIELISSSGSIKRIIKGEFALDRAVTN